jgi:hypothetical protein
LNVLKQNRSQLSPFYFLEPLWTCLVDEWLWQNLLLHTLFKGVWLLDVLLRPL